MQYARRILAAATLMAGVALALPAHAARAPATRAVGGIDVPEEELAMPTAIDASQELVMAEATPPAMVVELVRAAPEDPDPFQRARDYGRLLFLVSVPAAFVGLHLHLSRRAHIVPPQG
jgi:hypothetical protein